MLLGMAAPTLAALQSHETCSMKCCAESNHAQMMQMEHAQKAIGDQVNKDCPAVNDCSPQDIPAPLQIESELPAQKFQCKIDFSFTTLSFITSQISTPSTDFYTFRDTFFRTSRDILTSQSILLI